MDSEGFFALRERRSVSEEQILRNGAMGILISEKGKMRLLVTWMDGRGGRATYSAVVSRSGPVWTVLAGSQNAGGDLGPVAYDLGRAPVEPLEVLAAAPGEAFVAESIFISAFALESAGFTDHWQRIR